MQFQPKHQSLKSGTSITIRPPNLTEAQKLLDLKRSYIKNTISIPLTLAEYPDDLEKEARIIAEYEEAANSILLVAVFESELIGNIDLTGSKRSKMAHTAMIGMGIAEKWRNQGLGKILVEAVIDWTKNYSEIETIWLDVYASNELGVNLYKITGFKISGIIPDFFKNENGYDDKIQMYQRL